MRDKLAERLLAQVMKWSEEDDARERPNLQALSNLKYNEYQQFSPGMRFIESLAIWLRNFQTSEEKRVAYQFIRNRLVFISSAEMRHIVSTAYSHYVSPMLINEFADKFSVPKYKVSQITNSLDFKILRRKSLFLGLSDGSHIDEFRRYSDLSNEQFYVDYRIDNTKITNGMIGKLEQDIDVLTEGNPNKLASSFEIVFLLNDFSASSNTLLRSDANGSPVGKLASAINTIIELQRRSPPLIKPNQAKVFVV